MFVIHRDISTLKYAPLMDLYDDDHRAIASREYPHLAESEALFIVEQEFYGYLAEDFFLAESAFVAVIEDNGKYLSGLRMEPFQDGWLLTGLMTHAFYRGQGYGSSLLRFAMNQLPLGTRLYSHVDKTNSGSASFHMKNGFCQEKNWAQMLNGEILHNFWTFIRHV